MIKKSKLKISETVLKRDNKLKINLKLYETLLKIQSPSCREENMIKFIEVYIKKFHNDVSIQKDKFGNLYLMKGKLSENEYYPCIVAHLDEYHDPNKDRVIQKIGDFYIGFDIKEGEQEGIGADDKNGILIALMLLNQFDKLKVYFPIQEELGMVGTRNCDMNWFKDVGYLLQPDRRGNSDFIIHTNNVLVASDGFLNCVSPLVKEFGYDYELGIATDIGVLVQQDVGVSAVNISCGYWNEHHDNEKCHIPSFENCLNLVYEIINKCGLKRFEHSLEDALDDTKYALDEEKDFSIPGDFDDFVMYSSHPCELCRDFDCSNCKLT